MAAEQAQTVVGEEEEPKIPVFTVLKNGAILKNIFIVNKPPVASVPQESEEEILIVGRHPDCHIVLTHPSVSRFHLQILSNPSSQKLALTDLSSVHGTWISEKRIEPGVRVELRQGDTLRVGASSRLYRLHWIPLSLAYEQDSLRILNCLPVDKAEPDCSDGNYDEIIEPLVPQGGDQCVENETYEIDQVVNVLPIEKEKIIESLSSHDKGEASPIVQVFGKDQGQSDMSALLSAGPFVRENSDLLIGEVVVETKYQQVEEDNLSLETKSDLLVNLDGKSSIMEDHGQTDQLCLTSEPLQYSDEKEEGACPAADIPGGTDGQSSLSKDHGQTDNDLCPLYGPFVMGNSSLLVEEALGEVSNQPDEEENSAHKPTLLVNLDIENSNEIRCLVDERCGETEKRSVSFKNFHEKRDIKTISSVLLGKDSVDSFSPDGVLSEIIDDKENQTPQSICIEGGQPESEFCKSPPLTFKDKSIFGENIWARRGKPACAVRIQTERSRKRSAVGPGIDNNFELEVEIFTPDKENLTPNTRRLRSLNKKNELEVKLDDTQEEREIFTPDKENFTPNTLQLKSLKKKGNLELINSKSHRSSVSKQNLISNIPSEDLLLCPVKDNQKLKDLQERQSVGTTARNQVMLEKELMLTKLGRERTPFQSLKIPAVKNSSSEASVSDVATKSSTSLLCSQTKEKVKNPLSNKIIGEDKKGWIMVADANTLLNKESRKALQLLQGLKGTHLIVPRMVIRELDCLKQRGSLFRKKPEACLVLEWIEECMIKTNWWIHVQSSLEDERLLAPTPPASPQSLCSENSWELTSRTTTSFPFLRCWRSMELVSPAAEDHILDCALSRRKRSNEQLVLLSNDIALKIKAMAEGLICETAQEFHESLMTPSSERFMWAGSCPRGRTWSYLDDVVLAGKHNRCQLKKSSKGEGAKGLKLILLHNSHYGQIH